MGQELAQNLSNQLAPRLSTPTIAALYREATAQESLGKAFEHPARKNNIGNELDPARNLVNTTIKESAETCGRAQKFLNKPAKSIEQQLEDIAEDFDKNGVDLNKLKLMQEQLQGQTMSKEDLSAMLQRNKAAEQFFKSADDIFSTRSNARLDGTNKEALTTMQQEADDLLRHSLQRIYVNRPIDVVRQLGSSELAPQEMVALMRSEISITKDAISYVRTSKEDLKKFETGIKEDISKTIKDPNLAESAFQSRMAHIRDRASFLPSSKSEIDAINSSLENAGKSIDRAESLFKTQNGKAALGQIYAAFYAIYP